MMAKKIRTVYECSACNEQFPRWAGKCPACGAWNTIVEKDETTITVSRRNAELHPLPTLNQVNEDDSRRIRSGIDDFDLVLGGGLVPGSFLLIGGEPGVGKSTLLLEIARAFHGRILYFSGEESPGQIKMRANRMQIDGSRILVSRESVLDAVCSRIMKERPDLAVIDSIQTLQVSDGLPGSVSQIRAAAFGLMETAKVSRIPILVTGHITKDGSIAGPMLLEHMVDAVLYFESDRLNHYRILRAVKNRFGNIGEVALFEMTGTGLRALSTLPRETTGRGAPGCVFSAIIEGSRSIGVEVQALVSRTAYGPARRMAEGLDNRRLMLLSAVLEKYLKLNLADQDIFANLAGGLTAHEPALDLAIGAAILSSYTEKPAPDGMAFAGEIGLSGEIRPAPGILARIRELKNLGFRRFCLCETQKEEAKIEEADILPVRHIRDIVEVIHEN
jgi:DNA repair protein RadA/Sms